MIPVEPGWYEDPSGEATHEAYWDGEKWTGATRPDRKKRRRRQVTIGLAIGVAVLGSWAEFSADSRSEARAFLRDYVTTNFSETGVSAASTECAIDGLIDAGADKKVADLDVDSSGALDPAGTQILSALADDFENVLDECLTDEELLAFSKSTDVTSFGSNPGLDRLWTACTEGEFSSCDLLWVVGDIMNTSDTPSDYTRFGDTCGERTVGPSQSWCVDLYGAGVDTGLLRSECDSGDFESCDLLYIYSRQGDPALSEFAVTCGERVESDDIPCMFRFGQAFIP